MRTVFLLLWTLFLGAAFCAGGCRAQVPGDASADSTVDVGDVVYELNYLFREGPPPVFFECGDPTADCLIDLADVVYLLNYLFKEGPDPQIVECGWSEPVNLGQPVNSDRGDYCVSFSLDMKRMVLASEREGTMGNEDIWYSSRSDTAESWPDPINCGPNVNTAIRDLHPCISADGNQIYFAAWERPGGCGSWDIWFTTWDSAAGEWGVPQNGGTSLNHETSDWSPFVTVDGSELYLRTGYLPGGLAVSQWTGDEWGVPVWLGLNLHENWTEEQPCVTADRRTLYFTRWVEGGVQHIFVSYWTGTEWGIAIELPPHINYPGTGTRHPWISPDGSRLYFTSGSRPGGVGHCDIWVSERTPVEEGKRYINRNGDASEDRK